MQQGLLSPLFVQDAPARWLEAEHLAYEHGQSYDSYFTTEDGWKRFRTLDHSGLISYRRLGKYAKIIGGLLAAEEDKPALLGQFVAFSDAYSLVTSFYNVPECDIELFREHGFQVTKWGEEPFIDLQDCTWSGKQYEWVRRQTNYCRRAGITIVEHQRSEMDEHAWNALMRQLRAVSDELLATKPHAHEIQLVEGQLDMSRWGRRRLFVAYSGGSDSRIEGFMIALPLQGGRQWSFEMYRHRVDAVRGVVPYLFHEVMMRMKEEGVESVSLCLIPGLGCEQAMPGDSKSTRLGLTIGKKYLNFLFDFAGLYHFKSRFRPRYESRYVCSRPGSNVLSTIALFRMSGLLTFSGKKVAKNFLSKQFKRGQRKSLADRAEV